MIVVSYKEPYVHWYGPETIECGRPKGTVTRAFDQYLRQSGGLWVARSWGNADRVVSSPAGKVAVPPQNSLYDLKRIWLTQKQEKEHYYGFSCGGLWSMCHQVPDGVPLGPDQFIPYEPVFFEKFWRTYQEVNQIFAKSVAEEIADESPVIWIKDFPLALVPEMLRAKKVEAQLVFGWFIPWPHASFLKCCPWIQQIIKGLLGSDVLFFNSRKCIQNFLVAAGTVPGVKVDPGRSTIQLDQREVSVQLFSVKNLLPQSNRSLRYSI